MKEYDFRENNIVWLQPAPANNTWAVAIRQDVAQAEGLVTLEDFADFVNAGGTVKLAGSEEFVSRPDALPSFEEAYGFNLSDDQLLILSGGNTATTIQAAARQTDGVNTAMAYGTDGALAALGLVVMRDSLGVQPVYEPAPIVRAEILVSDSGQLPVGHTLSSTMRSVGPTWDGPVARQLCWARRLRTPRCS